MTPKTPKRDSLTDAAQARSEALQCLHGCVHSFRQQCEEALDRALAAARLDQMEIVHKILDGRDVEFAGLKELHAERVRLRRLAGGSNG